MLESVALNLALNNGGEGNASPEAKTRLLQGGRYFSTLVFLDSFVNLQQFAVRRDFARNWI